ncbi:MAG: hypothetical protein JRI47_08985, partial [Deltaproteobacteria bacterium]|nr:hypothetical protein [Deltaproteobacteria bacterium]
MQNRGSGQFEPTSTFDYFRKAIQIIKLHQPVMAEVAQDQNALRFGILVTAAGGALAFSPGKNLAAPLVGALFSILALFFFAALVHLFCGYAKGKQEFMGFVRIMAMAGILDWAVIVPYADGIVTVWSVVVSIAAAGEVYHLGQARAVFTVIISAM